MKTTGHNYPLLSILIAVYNQEKYVAETIESFFHQDYPNLEMIVIDDGSPDNSYAVAQTAAKNAPFKTTILTQKNEGASKTFNKLGQMAKGELLTFMGGDDVAIENTLMERAQIVLQNDKCMWCAGNGYFLRDTQKTEELMASDREIEKILTLSPAELHHNATHNIVVAAYMYLQSMVLRKSLFDAIGGFDTDLLADDLVFGIKSYHYMAENTYFCTGLKNPVFYYRIHDTNLHKNKPYIWQLYTQLADRYLENPKNLITRTGLAYYKYMLRSQNRVFMREVFLEIYKNPHTHTATILLKTILIFIRFSLKKFFSKNR